MKLLILIKYLFPGSPFLNIPIISGRGGGKKRENELNHSLQIFILQSSPFRGRRGLYFTAPIFASILSVA